MQNAIESKSFDFAVRIVNLYKFLYFEQKESVMSKQVLKSGTSIGANVNEAQKAQSMADFATKMNIALKEANETLYWIRLLHRTNYINDKEYDSISRDANELVSILTSICKTSHKHKRSDDDSEKQN